MTKVRYTDAIGDWTVREASLTDHLHHIGQACEGAIPPTTRCEVLQHGSPTLPYFDFDSIVGTDEAGHRERAWNRCRRAITEIFGADPTFSFDSNVAHAHRHGWVGPGRFKVSFRFWVRGYSIMPEQMPSLIKACTPSHMHDVFDFSIYSKRRLLACVGGVKGGGDTRVLEVDDPAMVEWCVCQRLSGDEVKLDVKEETTAPIDPSNVKLEHYEEWGVLREVLVQAGFVDPVYKGRRELSVSFTCSLLGVSCPCCSHVHDHQVCIHERTESAAPRGAKDKNCASYRTGGV